MGHLRHEHGIIAFGNRLRKLRLEKGLSQQELAFAADVELSQISRIERGVINTSISQVFNIADAMEMHPSKLFDFEIKK